MHIRASVTAGAKKERLVRTSDTHFRISVREEAERNQANRRVIDLLAAYFKVPAARVRIVKGHRAPSKLVSVGDSTNAR